MSVACTTMKGDIRDLDSLGLPKLPANECYGGHKNGKNPTDFSRSNRRPAIHLWLDWFGMAHDKTWGKLVLNGRTEVESSRPAQTVPNIVGTVPALHSYGFESTILLAFMETHHSGQDGHFIRKILPARSMRCHYPVC